MSPIDPPEATGPGAEIAEHLAGIARILLVPGDVPDVLARVVTLAAASINGCDEAGLCDVSGNTLPSTPLMAELDRVQQAVGEGPCIDTMAGADSVYVGDLSKTPLWPRFAPSAAAAGLRSVLAYRLFVAEDTLGALQLFARRQDAFSAQERAEGLIFAAHAGMALGVAQHQADARGRSENLQAALLSREIIGQAQGILMERERITADQAFDLLRRTSQHLNVKLRDVAQRLVDTGAVPGVERSGVPDSQR